MFKFVIFSLAITYVSAGILGGAGLALSTGGGYGAGYAAPLARSAPIGPVIAAVQSRRTYDVIPVASSLEAPIPQVIEVEPNEQPVQFIFRSQSSPVLVQQVHTPGVAQQESTRSEEEPHQLVHEVYKPIFQEVREVIQPFRKVIQKVEPVLEEVNTLVAKGEPGLRAALPLTAAVPLAAPLATPLAAPLATPLAAPLAIPLAAPLATPLAAPLATPLAAPLAIPLAAPLATPLAAPLATPLAAPLLKTVRLEKGY